MFLTLLLTYPKLVMPSSSSSIETHSAMTARTPFRFSRSLNNGNVARLISVFIHSMSICVYLRPISHSPQLIQSPPPILDEMHIFSSDHADVLGSSSLHQLFTNDYWGRSMNSPSSHKSYRPLSILSFRWVKHTSTRNAWISDVFLHRLIGILLHSAMGEMIARIAHNLFVPGHKVQSAEALLFYCLVKAFFLFHPTHIEVVVNVANRAHLLALCFIFIQLDPNIPIAVLALVHMAGLLTCETAIFALPAIICTLIYSRFRQRVDAKTIPQEPEETMMDDTMEPPSIPRATQHLESISISYQEHSYYHLLVQTTYTLLPRILVLVTISSSYLLFRHFKDWIQIPTGLIRPAENPFFAFQGWKRFVNYSHLLIIHCSKSLGMGFTDWVGFSHEYGYDCIPAITTLEDTRCILLLLFLITLCLIGIKLYTWGIQDSSLVLILAMSWMATLFPISGFIKVGTCVADRIVLPSTVVGSVFWAKTTSTWIHSNNKMHTLKCLFVLILFVFLYLKVDSRSREWMDHTLLLESSLRSCPRSAKSNLELSKIYSGLSMEKYDLDKAMGYLDTAESIDPEYCDIHFQVAQILFRKQEYLDFEKRLVKGILCPFSMQGALDLWNKYWSVVLQDPTLDIAQVKKRYLSYQAILEDAVVKEKQMEDEKKRRKDRVESNLKSKDEF